MSESPRCPKCGIQLPADAPADLCPKCLVQAGFESQPLSASAELGPTKLTPPASGFVPPTVEELAPLFPQLEILELLGKGGMGAVYKARQPGLDRLVAVKILPPEISHDPAFAERFQREARALARLSHPHIVAVYDFGIVGQAFQPDSLVVLGQARKPDLRDGGLCYIVMEFVDGANLRQAIQTKTLTSAEALAIVPQICEALQFAHDEGIVHRDIKPENILIDKRGRVKIADFGLAKLLGQDASDHSLTATHQVMGTLRYMAPEQMQGSREVDHRADIYSLGVVFYELLTGELPMGRFAPPSKKVQVDVRLDEVVLRALEQDPEQRYQHASDVKSELDSIRTTPAPTKPFEQRDPLEPFREVARFAMTPNPSYAKRVGIPSAILLGLFLMVMMTAFSLYGLEDNNYPGHPKVLIIANGALLFWLGVIILHVAFFVRRVVPADFWATVTLFLEETRRSFVVAAETRMRDQKTETAPVSLPGPRLVQAPADCLLLAAGIALVTACGVAVWLLASPASSLVTSIIRADLIGMSVGLAIYSVLVGVAGLLLRRLRVRLFVLRVAVIVGLFFPAVCALNVVMDLRNIPVWPVVIPLWLGMPAALWVVVTLFRDDVRRAFDAADKQRAEKSGTGPVAWVSTEPRFSRFAIAGTVWALFGLLAVIPTLYFIGLNRVWNGTALPTDVIHSEPPLAFSIFMGALLAIGSGAPIGTTIYGAIAIGHIKRSGGKIVGLPLAVADVLFFPLLVLSGLIAALVARVAFSMAAHPNAADVTSAGAIGVLVAMGGCFFVARAAWRAVAGNHRLGDQIRGTPVATPIEAIPSNGIGRISLWAAISGVVLPALLLSGGIVLSSRFSISDGFVAACFLLGVGLELVAVGCGIAARQTPPGKAGLIVGSIALVLWLATLLTVPMREEEATLESESIIESNSLPPLGTITNGIGVQFTVPAGQVATFEIVTRRDNETVAIPSHCAYLMASPDKPEAGVFRWAPIAKENAAGSHWNYRIEMRTAGGGGGHSEATLLPNELNAAVGARGLSLGLLEPNEEVIHWGTADANNLPANGLIGLRVTVVAHGLKQSGSGAAHIDWKKSQTMQSTTRRKLPEK